MKKVLQLALGIIAAIGGFVDIGELVFDVQAGAGYRYQLLWAVVVGVIGIIVFAEMTGRVAAVSGRPVFDVVRMRMGFNVGLVTLVASLLINLLTLAAEVGGVAIVLDLLFDVKVSTLILVGVMGIVLIVYFVPFDGIERIFGYLGCGLLVYVAAAVKLKPDWHHVVEGLVPSWHASALYAYFVVGVIGAALVPYEVYFYSSGAIEDGWGPKDLNLNRANVILGFGLGGLLSIALIVVSAQVFAPLQVDPGYLGTTALGAQHAYGETGLLLALLGMLFAIGGAAVECAFSGAYTLAQFAGWEWGKYRGPGGAPRFTLTWLIFFGLAFVIVETGVDPVILTEYAVIFSVVALPLTYLPVLLIARDPTFMGEHVNGPVGTVLGWVFFGIILIVAVAAIPLILITHGGSG
ncbi:MAG: manganese transport protein [Solirubrobacteraceae bacterium]|jgi:Mn2+/Fe2+ NRAMP family transporter|nr:manganese transport protein [Solirubrobacteraceae bacterium]